MLSVFPSMAGDAHGFSAEYEPTDKADEASAVSNSDTMLLLINLRTDKPVLTTCLDGPVHSSSSWRGEKEHFLNFTKINIILFF